MSKPKQLSINPGLQMMLKYIERKQNMYRTHYLSKNPAHIQTYKQYAIVLNRLKRKAEDNFCAKAFQMPD